MIIFYLFFPDALLFSLFSLSHRALFFLQNKKSPRSKSHRGRHRRRRGGRRRAAVEAREAVFRGRGGGRGGGELRCFFFLFSARGRERAKEITLRSKTHSYASNIFSRQFHNRTRTTRMTRKSKGDLRVGARRSLEGRERERKNRRERKKERREIMSFFICERVGRKRQGTIRFLTPPPPIASPTFCFVFSKER